MKRRLAVLAATMLGGGKLDMRVPPDEYDDWLLDPDLVRLRAEWITAFTEWNQIADASAGADLTDEQHAKLRRYYEAETAYFDRCRAPNSGTG